LNKTKRAIGIVSKRKHYNVQQTVQQTLRSSNRRFLVQH